MILLTLWKDQPGKYFCVSTKTGTGIWKDHFFTRGELKNLKDFLADNSDKDLYFCPHGFSRPRRIKENAEIPKLLWADLDEVNPRELGALFPSIAIESSPGRYVGLWVIDNLMTEEINRSLTYTINADKGGWDLTQVLRIPGTYNYKYVSKPKVKTLWIDGPSYRLKDIEANVKKIDPLPETKGLPSTIKLLYNKYERYLSAGVRRELLSGRPVEGKRSEVVWKLVNSLVQAGATKEETFELIRVSPWNKFKNREDGDQQLKNAIDKAITEKIPGIALLKGETLDTLDEQEEPTERPRFLARSIADVEEDQLDWIWYPYLARGELTILEGDPGLGKSYMAQMVAKAIVDGEQLPSVRYGLPVKGSVAYFDLENSAGSVTKKRLKNNGCQNLQLFFQEEEPFSIGDDDALALVYEALEKLRPTLVVFDTLNTYMGNVNTNNSTETQQVFRRFREIAARFNCSVLVLRHLTKNSKDMPALYRGQGSIAFAGLARVVMTIGQSPLDEDERVMAVTKINVTRPPRALSFRIKPLPDLDKETDRSVFLWRDFVDLHSDQILVPVERKPSKMKEEAEDFLRNELKDGPKYFGAIVRVAEAKGLGLKTLYRAAEQLGVVKKVIGFGKSRQSIWSLPK